MGWVTEYDWSPAGDGTVDLNARVGSTYTDGEGVTWDVNVFGAASGPSFGIHATDGLGINGTASAASVYSEMTATIAELVAAGGGHAYDPHTDAIEVWIEYASLSFGVQGTFCYANVLHHSGANRYDGIGKWFSTTIQRVGSVDDEVSSASLVAVNEATFGADGVFAWQMAGLQIGCGYSNSPGIGTDFSALTANVSGRKYLGMAVRSGAGSGGDSPTPTLSLDFVSMNTGATTQRIKRIVVRRWRGYIA